MRSSGGASGVPVSGAAAAVLALLLAGCASGGGGATGPAPTGVTPGRPAPGMPGAPRARPTPKTESRVPPIPEVTGPLALHVEYPDSLRLVTVPDSNFLFGTTGTGDATLIIDGEFVKVEPNGAFLAWLPVPPATNADTAYYRLVARRGSEVDTLTQPILRPAPPPVPDAAVWVDSTALESLAERWADPGDTIALSVRAASGLRAWLTAGRRRFPLREVGGAPLYRASATAAELLEAGCGTGSLLPGLAPPGKAARAAGPRPEGCASPDSTSSVHLEVTLTDGRTEARTEGWLPLRVIDPAAPPRVRLDEAADSVNGTNGIVVGRPLPSGPYHWRFPDGTVASATGRKGDRVRLRLGEGLESWVSADAVDVLRPTASPLRGVVGDLSVAPDSGSETLRIPLTEPLPARVREVDERTLELTLYGGVGRTNRIGYGAGGRLIRSVDWEERPGPAYVLTVRLRDPVWGYRLAFADASPGGAELDLRIRRTPRLDPHHPMRGLRIAVDPGHPGAGAHGPTGFYEGDANLAIGRKLAQLLQDAGADPVLVRTDTLPVGLYERTRRAEEAGAELFVSIHNNAFPDGVNPFDHAGTSTYYNHSHSEALAAAVQRGLLDEMGLRDLGVYWADLAVVRMAWMPAILTEGAFMTIPAQEAALKDPDFQEDYARGVLKGIRRFLEERARELEGEER